MIYGLMNIMKYLFVFFALLACGVIADTAEDALALAQRTLAYVEKSERRPEMAAELTALAQKLPQTREAAARSALEKQIRVLRRQILFSHPALAFDRLLASQRGLPYTVAPHMVDPYTGRCSRPGPGLVVIEDWKGVPRKVEPLKASSRWARSSTPICTGTATVCSSRSATTRRNVRPPPRA